MVSTILLATDASDNEEVQNVAAVPKVAAKKGKFADEDASDDDVKVRKTF